MAGSRLDAYTEHTFTRSGLDRLPVHLEDSHGIRVADLTELDVGVFRVDREDGPAWVARVFPAARPVAAAEGDADILRFLAEHDFPAERCAATPAVTVHEDQAVLVTGFLPGDKAGRGRRAARPLGDLLGRLHTLPPGEGAVDRDGGGWHHLAFQGGPRAELDAALALLAEARERVPAGQEARYERLRGELERIDDGQGLPEALIHPDFVAANAITAPDGGLTMIDWAGSGHGSRLWSLAFLLWAAAGRDLAGVDAVMSSYLRHVTPEPGELARLAAVIPARPLVFAAWAFCVGRGDLLAATRDIPAIRDRAGAIATRAAQAHAHAPSAAAGPRTTTSPAPVGPGAPGESTGPGERSGPADGSASVGATGLGVAAIRAAETNRPDRLFADPLAAAFVAASGWTPPDRPPEGRVRALVRWVVARTVFLDGLIADAVHAGCRQAVLLGAGFDARAFRLPWPPAARLFELDSADVLNSKARILAQQAAQPVCDRVPVACDLREDWPGALLAAGFDAAQPTVWVAEGLLVYLDWDEVQGLIADLTELSAPGSRLGLTMATRPPTGDGWIASLRRSTAPDDPAAWLAGHGWTAELTNPSDVLAAHGRLPDPGDPARPDTPPRALLVAATR